MCDYSLMEYDSRLAVDGEELEIHRFSCGAKGLVVPSEPVLGFWNKLRRFWNLERVTQVVCVPPGARLLLYDVPAALREKLAVGCVEEVSFDQLCPESGTFRDAVRFDNGCVLSLQQLSVGGRVKVLRFSGADDHRVEAPDQEIRFA